MDTRWLIKGTNANLDKKNLWLNLAIFIFSSNFISKLNLLLGEKVAIGLWDPHERCMNICESVVATAVMPLGGIADVGMRNYKSQ